ncbi:MAG: ParB/RepB/Spo0J family partition protein, partial [Chloroflexota bacterium]
HFHPVAALFPMMSDEELDDLAEDIKTSGLVHPIVLSDDGVLIDGRHRLEACRRAGVEPRFERLNGHEPVAFILSNNIARRHLSKGQAAMAVAQARRVSGVHGNKVSAREAAEGAGTSKQRVIQASVVLGYGVQPRWLQKSAIGWPLIWEPPHRSRPQ